jgi:hypothetical protein
MGNDWRDNAVFFSLIGLIACAGLAAKWIGY